MFRIGEFSKLTQVSVRMLRYYDETGLLKPEKIDKFTGYRIYSTEQISLLNKIIFLRDVGFNVSEIAVILEKWGNKYITSELEKKKNNIEDNIKTEQAKLARIELAKRDILKEQIDLNYNVSIKAIPSYQVLTLRRVVSDYYAEGQLWKEMSDFVKQNQISISYDTFTIYHDVDYKEDNVDMELCASVDKIDENKGGFTYREIESEPTMACTLVRGSFENIAGVYQSFANWLEEHNQYIMKGQSRQIIHKGEWNTKNSSEYLTEIQIPLKYR